jgi:hypothetical protein
MTLRPASTVRTESCLLLCRLAAARLVISALTGIPRFVALCYRLAKPIGSRREYHPYHKRARHDFRLNQTLRKEETKEPRRTPFKNCPKF